MLVAGYYGDFSTYQALVDDVLDHRLNRVTVQMEGKNGQGKRSKTYDVDAENVRASPFSWEKRTGIDVELRVYRTKPSERWNLNSAVRFQPRSYFCEGWQDKTWYLFPAVSARAVLKPLNILTPFF